MLAAAAALGFNLKRRMLYACRLQALPEGMLHFLHLRDVVDDDVCREGRSPWC